MSASTVVGNVLELVEMIMFYFSEGGTTHRRTLTQMDLFSRNWARAILPLLYRHATIRPFLHWMAHAQLSDITLEVPVSIFDSLGPFAVPELYNHGLVYVSSTLVFTRSHADVYADSPLSRQGYSCNLGRESALDPVVGLARTHLW